MKVAGGGGGGGKTRARLRRTRGAGMTRHFHISTGTKTRRDFLRRGCWDRQRLREMDERGLRMQREVLFACLLSPCWGLFFAMWSESDGEGFECRNEGSYKYFFGRVRDDGGVLFIVENIDWTARVRLIYAEGDDSCIIRVSSRIDFIWLNLLFSFPQPHWKC